MRVYIVMAFLTLFAACGGGEPSTSEIVASAEPGPATIDETGDGKTYTYSPGSEFAIDLDPARHPRAALDSTDCDTKLQAGVRRLNPNGTTAYPAGFLSSGNSGSCEIVNGSFTVRLAFEPLGD